MDARTLATIVVRVFGLYLICNTGPTCVWALVELVRALVADSAPSPEFSSGWDIAGHLGTGLVFLLGVYMLLDGRQLIDHLLFVVPGRCARCGYDVRSIDSGVCPECGAPIPSRRKDPPGPPPIQP